MKVMKKMCAAALATALMFSGTAVPVISNAETEPVVAPTVDAKTELKEIVKKTNDMIMNGTEDVLISEKTLTSPENQMVAYAQNVLVQKDKKVKCVTNDINEDGSPEMFVLYSSGKLEVYSYGLDVVKPVELPKPVGTVKNVKEVRVSKGSTFVVKTVKGKTTSYIKYKFSINGLSKSTTYTKKGKVYKKGSKKIKAKAFNKYVKSYKKQTKYVFAKADVGYVIDLYDNAGFLASSKDLIVRKDSNYEDGEMSTVFRCDTDATASGYRAFIEKNGMAYRFVFGPETVDPKSADKKTYQEEDWRYYRDVLCSLEMYIPSLSMLDEYTVTKKSNEANEYDEYVVLYGGEDYEGDTYLSVIVNKDGKIESVSDEMSVGFASMRFEFSYGAEASYDGELYSPGLDTQIYPSAVTYEFPTRVMTMDYSGTESRILTDANVLFMPVSHYGDFSVDGMVFSSSSLFLYPSGEEYTKFNGLLNPSTTGTGFDSVPLEDGTGKLSWKAKESLEEI